MTITQIPEVVGAASIKPPRIRSASYPSYSHSFCVDLVKRIYQNFGTTDYYTREEIAKVLGISVGHIQTQLSSSAYYGLLDLKVKAGYKPTELFLKIHMPLDDAEKKDGLLKSLCHSEMYSTLINEFRYSMLPSLTAMSTILVRRFGIAEKVTQQAASIFIENLEEYGFIDPENRVLFHDTEVVPDTKRETVTIVKDEDVISNGNLERMYSIQPSKINGRLNDITDISLDQQELIIPFKSGEEVKLFYPKGIKDEQWDKVIRVIAALKE